jgi:hypothetical protein
MYIHNYKLFIQETLTGYLKGTLYWEEHQESTKNNGDNISNGSSYYYQEPFMYQAMYQAYSIS